MKYIIEQTNLFKNWLQSLRDRQSQYRIMQRILRMEDGNLGDIKHIDNDLYEARCFFGPGYRLYFTFKGEVILLLLIEGDKSTQRDDINKAREILSSKEISLWKK